MFSLPTVKTQAQQVKPENISIRKGSPVPYGVVAGETVSVAIPKDHFIHALRLRVVLGTFVGGSTPAWTGTAAEDIVTNVVIRADGSKRFKEAQWKEFKQLCVVNKEAQTSGYLKLYFTDPKLPEAMPLPAWKFTSLVIDLTFAALSTLTTGSPTGTVGTKVEVTLEESHWDGEEISNWPVLVEVVRGKTVYGANSGWQTYEHERVNVDMGFLYHADDNGTDSDAIFDTLRVIGRRPNGSDLIYDEVDVLDIKEANKNAFLSALATGYWMLEFPALNTSQYSSLKTELFIGAAGTNAGVRVIERYTL